MEGRATQKNEFEICGRILDLIPPQYINETLSKATFIMQVWAGRRENQVSFDFFNDRMKILDGFKKDDWVILSFQLKGKRVQTKDGKIMYFNSLEGLNCIKG